MNSGHNEFPANITDVFRGFLLQGYNMSLEFWACVCLCFLALVALSLPLPLTASLPLSLSLPLPLSRRNDMKNGTHALSAVAANKKKALGVLLNIVIRFYITFLWTTQTIFREVEQMRHVFRALMDEWRYVYTIQDATKAKTDECLHWAPDIKQRKYECDNIKRYSPYSRLNDFSYDACALSTSRY